MLTMHIAHIVIETDDTAENLMLAVTAFGNKYLRLNK